VRGAGFEPARPRPSGLKPDASSFRQPRMMSPASIDLARPKATRFENVASAFRHRDVVETLIRALLPLSYASMVPADRFELPTFSLRVGCATAAPRRR
jgi:hypothetical protein